MSSWFREKSDATTLIFRATGFSRNQLLADAKSPKIKLDMTTLPSFERFSELAANHDLVPVYRRFLSDSLTPVTAFQLLDDGHSAACLFESVIGGEKVGRYSFIATGAREG